MKNTKKSSCEEYISDLIELLQRPARVRSSELPIDDIPRKLLK